MRERAGSSLLFRLRLSALSRYAALRQSQTHGSAAKTDTPLTDLALYCEGLSIEEIGRQRGLTEMTIEKHLADCITQGREVDISRHVSDADRALIEIAIDQLGTQLLKPLRDALPSHINYRMIRFVVADVQRAEQQEAGMTE